ncbi:hypothetical protein KVU_0064 [Ketogulonicigenium vulgare WSH-001]|uniref:Uncharacterized protein n=1 Tax=Ketogulonicigenium vulgare (strain WSH-001) TaxID=759362 RepID=F9Y7T7_KETVW|nr:hypothetical protein KVU_0064 [Ketogulonicigenium vulgare WSH-001]
MSLLAARLKESLKKMQLDKRAALFHAVGGKLLHHN